MKAARPPRRAGKDRFGRDGALTLILRLRSGNEIAMGPGKASLLEAIEMAQSISAAARAMGMSYRRAWVLVDTMNRAFRKPLVETTTGGKRGGGARVTPLGLEVLRRFRSMEARALAAVEPERSRLVRLLAPRSRD